MKFNLKMIAVAAAMVSAAGAANAAPTTTGQNGSLVLTAFNTVTNVWYMRDTGYLLNSFLPSSVTTLSGDGAVTGDKTPDAGLTIDKTVTANFGDASFSTWLTGQTQSDVRWFVSAVDSVGVNSAGGTNRKRLITSSANPDQAATNGNVDGYISTGNAGGLSTLFGSGTLSVTGTDAPGAFGTNFGLGAAGLASLGDSVGLFYFARNSSSSTTSSTATQYGNVNGYSTVSLAANGDFTYIAPTSAVPVPAAAWLLGSGLLAMGGAIRRRKAAAQG